MKKLIFLYSLLLLAGCKKETLGPKGSEGKFEYTCTFKRYSNTDTLRVAIEEADKFHIVMGATNEFRDGYAFSFFVNNKLSQYLFMSNRKYYDEIRINGSYVSGVFDSDVNGNGYTFEGFLISSYPNPLFLQILDFPFPGWNRFVKTDD